MHSSIYDDHRDVSSDRDRRRASRVFPMDKARGEPTDSEPHVGRNARPSVAKGGWRPSAPYLTSFAAPTLHPQGEFPHRPYIP